MFGLLERDIYYITKVLDKYKNIKKAFIFGSRALGNYKNGSDIDLAICGDNVTDSQLYDISDSLNEVYPIPYFFDILIYENLTNVNLKNHIDDYGKIIYEKKQ